MLDTRKRKFQYYKIVGKLKYSAHGIHGSSRVYCLMALQLHPIICKCCTSVFCDIIHSTYKAIVWRGPWIRIAHSSHKPYWAIRSVGLSQLQLSGSCFLDAWIPFNANLLSRKFWTASVNEVLLGGGAQWNRPDNCQVQYLVDLLDP